MQNPVPDKNRPINSDNGNDEDMVAVMLPRKVLRQLAWLKKESGVNTATEALYNAIATEAYILEEVKKHGQVLIAKKN